MWKGSHSIESDLIVAAEDSAEPAPSPTTATSVYTYFSVVVSREGVRRWNPFKQHADDQNSESVTSHRSIITVDCGSIENKVKSQQDEWHQLREALTAYWEYTVSLRNTHTQTAMSPRRKIQ